MEASIRYYADGLGFEITHQWPSHSQPRWCRLARGGAALMLQQFPTEGHDAWRPEGPVGVGVAIYFICADALALYRAFRSRGIEASQPVVGNGMWVTSLSDPDGYQIHVEKAREPHCLRWGGMATGCL